MKLNWYQIATYVLILGLGFSLGWFLHKPIEPQMVEVPIAIDLDSARVEWVSPYVRQIKIKDGLVLSYSAKLKDKDRLIAELLSRDSSVEVRASSVDTTIKTTVRFTYTDSDSLTVHETSSAFLRISISYLGDPFNIYEYIQASVLPISTNIRMKERLREVPAETYGLWFMALGGAGEGFRVGGILGYKQFGIGGLWSGREPIFIAGYQYRF